MWLKRTVEIVVPEQYHEMPLLRKPIYKKGNGTHSKNGRPRPRARQTTGAMNQNGSEGLDNEDGGRSTGWWPRGTH